LTATRAPAQFPAVLVTLSALLPACDGFYYGPEPPGDPQTSFEVLWTEVDRHYAYFLEKGVDWDAVYAEYRPQVDATTSPRHLFDVMAAMLEVLRDGHVSLHAPGVGVTAYDGWIVGKRENYAEDVVTSYLVGGRKRTPGGRLTYGHLTSAVGYVHIRDFEGLGWVGDVDRALEDLRGVDGLVVDIRGNSGGSDRLSDPIAGRFADRTRLSQIAYYRDGPGHGDFGPPIEQHVSPSGELQFTGPVVLLTNRRVFSAGESFALHLRVLPHVTVVGDTTGGGAGNPIGRELPNGWGVRLSRWRATTPEGFSYEGIGLPPDVPVWISEDDGKAGRDSIVEKALEILGSS
jgi:carboxyl-terminal processing protease